MKSTGWFGTAAVALALLAGCNTMQGMKADVRMGQVTLSGKNEVPPIDSAATGTATVTVGADRGVKVQLSVSGMSPTAAHIHQGAAGVNGPVIVPLDKTGDSTFASKPDAKMTEAQYEAYKAGNTYLNVHSAKLPAGEIRAQLKGH
ncbi:MAG: CHRD domain-containing protein [Usitatibacter sp.]